MRPRLLRSFFIVLCFWLGGTTLYWSFSDPAVNWRSLVALKQLVPFLPITVPDEPSILTSVSVQLKVLAYWTAPVLALTALTFMLGYLGGWWRARGIATEREMREKGSGNYRGMGVTMGRLPEPPALPRVSLDWELEEDSPLRAADPKAQLLIKQVLETIAAHPDAYNGVGAVSPDSLLDHTVRALEQALATNKKHPGLAGCVAAAHELGYITAYEPTGQGGWRQTKNVDRAAASALASLPAWWELESSDRDAVLLAVKFKSTPALMPEPEGNQAVFRLAQDLLYAAKEAVQVVVEQERQKTLEKHELPTAVFDAFKRAMPLLAFQHRGLPKGVRAVAWKFGNRVYMLEIALRESVMAQLPADVAAALAPGAGRPRGRLQPFTVELLKALDGAGWLVKEINEMVLDPADAVWTIQAGKLEFRGVIVIDVPAEFMEALPPQDSMYEVKVTAAMFAAALKSQPAGEKVTRSALSDVLRFDQDVD